MLGAGEIRPDRMAAGGDQDVLGQEAAAVVQLHGVGVDEPRPRLVQLRPRRVQALDVEPGQPVDLVETFAFPLPFTVICELLGVPERAPLGHRCAVPIRELDTRGGAPEAGRADRPPRPRRACRRGGSP